MSISVLIVEDHPALRRLFADDVREIFSDAQIDTSECVSTALDALKTRHYTHILLDLGLPDTKGTEGVSVIKNQAPFAHLAVVSGNTAFATVRSVEALGARFIGKGELEAYDTKLAAFLQQRPTTQD